MYVGLLQIKSLILIVSSRQICIT